MLSNKWRDVPLISKKVEYIFYQKESLSHSSIAREKGRAEGIFLCHGNRERGRTEIVPPEITAGSQVAARVAQKLVGTSADDAEYEAGMAHHHFPCLASMGIDLDFNDTLLHVSDNIMKDSVGEQVKPYKHIQYLTPGFRSEE